MTATASLSDVVPAPGSDCREAFKSAYSNRYTWDPDFSGYSGICEWQQKDRIVKGEFQVGADLKATVEGIDDEAVQKAISSQLWEVAIHRVRRSFEETHAKNSFTAGDIDDVGLEVIVGGKSSGDLYRIKNNVVTMVHRHIHGTVVTIYTISTTDTGLGYLSHTYTSQYSDPSTGKLKGGKSHFTDKFAPLVKGGPWVLKERLIETDANDDNPASMQSFRFLECKPL